MGWGFKKAKKKQSDEFHKKYGRKLDVAYKSYKLICADGRITGDNNEQAIGLCAFNEKKIIIDIAHKDIELTLVHELVHATLESVGFRQMPNWSDDLEELVCENLASAIIKNFKISKR